MTRRMAWLGALVAAFLVVGVMPAGAARVGFGPPGLLVPGPGLDRGLDTVVTMSADWTLRGFTRLHAADEGDAVWYFAGRAGAGVAAQQTPYAGQLRAVAHDGRDTTFVVYEKDRQLKLGRRSDSTGRYAAPIVLATGSPRWDVFGYDASIVAADGRWWVVWSQLVGTPGPPNPDQQLAMFQQHTLLGVQGPTRITWPPATREDTSPKLAYYHGRVTLVWSRATNAYLSGPADLMTATSTGGPWSMRTFTSAGTLNTNPSVQVAGGITYLAWLRDGHPVLADNTSRLFREHRFALVGERLSLAVSAGRVFLAWQPVGSAIYLAQRTGRTWTGPYLAAPNAYPLAVLAHHGRATLVYLTEQGVYQRSQN